jgi:opacity protein-like surface antigen
MTSFSPLFSCSRLLTAATLLVVLAEPLIAQAQAVPSSSDSTELRVSGGIRLWSAKWDSWYTNPNVMLGTTNYAVVEALDNGTKLAPIASLGLSYGAVSLSASTLLKTTYSFDTTTFMGDNSRREYDITLGYSVSPGINLNLGQKQIDQTVIQAGSDHKHARAKGPVVGVNASTPLSSGWGLYGAFSKGFFKYQLPVADVSGKTRFSSDYQLLEAGLTYGFPSISWMQNFVLTAGYRTQRMATKGFGLGMTPRGQPTQLNRKAELVDVTQGFVLGMQGSF